MGDLRADLFRIIVHVLQDYIELQQHEYIAAALWILHTHVFRQFSITPRLALLSAVRGVGKTTLLDLIALLAARAQKTDHATPAWTYHHIDSHRSTLLADEGDNLGLEGNPTLRSVFNSGHRDGGSIGRFIGGQARNYSTFTPLAMAAIGTLPLPLMHRAIAIYMARHNGSRPLRRLDLKDPAIKAELDDVYRSICMCTRDLVLDTDPLMPAELRNRIADNWRVLISVADAFGHGEEARVAATRFSRGYHDEDLAVILLYDIRTVFDDLGVDRLTSAALVDRLNNMDDAQWSEWRGLKEDQQPRKLTQAQLAMVLRLFRIRPRTIRLFGRDTAKGYLRDQFEAAWRSYCPDADTTSQPSNVRYLRGAR